MELIADLLYGERNEPIAADTALEAARRELWERVPKVIREQDYFKRAFAARGVKL